MNRSLGILGALPIFSVCQTLPVLRYPSAAYGRQGRHAGSCALLQRRDLIRNTQRLVPGRHPGALVLSYNEEM